MVGRFELSTEPHFRLRPLEFGQAARIEIGHSSKSRDARVDSVEMAMHAPESDGSRGLRGSWGLFRLGLVVVLVLY